MRIRARVEVRVNIPDDLQIRHVDVVISNERLKKLAEKTALDLVQQQYAKGTKLIADTEGLELCMDMEGTVELSCHDHK